MTDFINKELEELVYKDFQNYMSSTDAEEIRLKAQAKGIPANILHNFLQASLEWTKEQHELFLNNDIEGLKKSLGVDKCEFLNSIDEIPDEVNGGEIINFASQEESDQYWLDTHPEAKQAMEAQNKLEEIKEDENIAL